MKHHDEVKRSRSRGREIMPRHGRVFTRAYQRMLKGVESQVSPRVAIAREEEAGCKYTDTGYTFSWEQYFHRWLLQNPAMLVEEDEEPEFVFVPHCASTVYLHLLAKYLKERSKDDPEPEFRDGHIWNVVKMTDENYMVNSVGKEVVENPVVERCVDRYPSCILLLAVAFGRHFYRSLSALLPNAVFLTHAGTSSYPQKNAVFRDGRAECRPACAEHTCDLDPLPIRPQDRVIPWPIEYVWTDRSASRDRPVLAFFGGTINSCSRKDLLRIYENHSDIIIFPPDGLKQMEWSALAHHARFCLVPDGDQPNTGRLLEVIMHGCIPVIISERLHPPFGELIAWTEIAIWLHEDEIPRLPEILRAVPESEVRARHDLLHTAAQLLHFSLPGFSITLIATLLHARPEQ